MTGTWFECRVRYDKTMDGGMNKKITESYVVDALSFTEAEARIVAEVAPCIHGEFEITDIRKVKYAEVFDSPGMEDARWYKCKLAYLSVDGNTGAEKRKAVLMLVQSDTFRHAMERIEEEMRGTMADYEIAAITESTVMEVFFYEAGTEMTEERAVASIIPQGATSVEMTVDGKGYTVTRTASGIRVTPNTQEECSGRTRRQKPESVGG